MKVVGMRELRAKSAALLGSGEPVVVTRHGKVSGVYVPLDEPAVGTSRDRRGYFL